MLLISILVFILHKKRIREFDDLKLNTSDQERGNEEQVNNHNKDNTNTNDINGKSEISVIANCVNNNFENINNSAMKDTDNMKEIINENVDMKSNKLIRENAEKTLMLELKKKLSVMFLKTAKMLLLKRFRRMIKPILNVNLKMIKDF